MKPEHVGQSFSDFLDELGIREDIEAQAIKEVLADRLRAAMHEQGLTKTAMAAQMGTSRRALNRLLDPENTSVTCTPCSAPPGSSAAASTSNWSICSNARPDPETRET